jgi:Cys-tRNA(Pro) deacylase
LKLDLEGYLHEAGLWHRFIEKPETVHTADASAKTGIPLNKITKNLVCKTANGGYALLVLPGDRRVNLQKAASALKTDNVQLLGPKEAEAVSGYPPGGTPSIHHQTPLVVIVDDGLLIYDTIYCGGGSRNRLLELKTETVLKLNNATVAKITQ